jgi:uncharacterized protein
MQGYFRLFPLPWVVFPEEVLHLHIFEPRYIQLVNECKERNELFGIPFHSGSMLFGTLVEILEIRKTYPNGEMDIIVKGTEKFEILRFDPMVTSKPYPGGKIKTLETTFRSNPKTVESLRRQLDTFYVLIGSRPVITNEDPDHLSFTYGHKIGLKPYQEMKLMLIADENERQKNLVRYLSRMIPGLRKAEEAKSRIKLNGHFKTFDPIRF